VPESRGPRCAAYTSSSSRGTIRGTFKQRSASCLRFPVSVSAFAASNCCRTVHLVASAPRPKPSATTESRIKFARNSLRQRRFRQIQLPPRFHFRFQIRPLALLHARLVQTALRIFNARAIWFGPMSASLRHAGRAMSNPNSMLGMTSAVAAARGASGWSEPEPAIDSESPLACRAWRFHAAQISTQVEKGACRGLHHYRQMPPTLGRPL
jgi:hypothetical protein